MVKSKTHKLLNFTSEHSGASKFLLVSRLLTSRDQVVYLWNPLNFNLLSCTSLKNIGEVYELTYYPIENVRKFFTFCFVACWRRRNITDTNPTKWLVSIVVSKIKCNEISDLHCEICHAFFISSYDALQMLCSFFICKRL